MVQVREAPVGDQPAELASEPHGSLRLRVRGTEQQGHIVRITSPRATIGGAPSCSVRLCAPGVRPFHCLVLQKDGQTVVRSLSRGNLLNGMPFREAPLRAGDRLRLGAFEFEVLANDPARWDGPGAERPCSAPGLPPERAGSAPSEPSDDVTRRIERLEQQLAEYERRCAGFANADAAVEARLASVLVDRMTEDLSEEREGRLREREQWRTERRQLEAELEQRDSAMRELSAQRAELEHRLKEALASRDELSGQLARLEASSAHDRRQQEAERQHFCQERDDWLATHQQLEARLAEAETRRSELARQVEADPQQQAAWDAERERSRLRMAQLQEALDQTASQLAQEREARTQERGMWFEEKRSLEAAVETATRQLAQCEIRFAQERAGWQRQSEEFESRIRAEEAALADREDELSRQRLLLEDFESRTEQQQEELATLRRKCAALEAAAAVSQAACAAEEVPEEVAASPDAWLEGYEERRPSEELRGQELDGLQAQLAHGMEGVADSSSSPEEAAQENRGDNSPSDQPAPPATAAATRSSDAAGPVTDHHRSSASGPGEREEESIEEYMKRLLLRIGAERETETLPSKPREGPACPPAEAETARQCSASESEDYVPLRRAPELAADMSSMRNLANETARSAITKHAKRNCRIRTKGHRLGVVASLGAAGAVAYLVRGDRALAHAALAAGAAVAACLACRAVFLRRKILKALGVRPCTRADKKPDDAVGACGGPEHPSRRSQQRPQDDTRLELPAVQHEESGSTLSDGNAEHVTS